MTGIRALTLQRDHWTWDSHGVPGSVSHVRALRLAGPVDRQALDAAVDEITATFSALSTYPSAFDSDGELTVRSGQRPRAIWTDLRGTADPVDECLAQLRSERDEVIAPEVRVRVVRLDADDTVVAVTAHEIMLDVPATYTILGAVIASYLGRFRAHNYRDLSDVRDLRLGSDKAVAARCRWWRRRLTERQCEVTNVDQRRVKTRALPISVDRWGAFATAGGLLGDNAHMGLIALTAWALRRSRGGDIVAFSTVLDLRSVFELGTAVGPFSDRLVFWVDLGGLDRPSYRDLLIRTQSGFLDSVVHYLPYAQVCGLAAENDDHDAHRPARSWDVHVNFCRSPRTSVSTRGEATLASRGLSIELFRESDLLGAEVDGNGGWDGRAIEMHLGESGDDTTVVLDVNTNDPRYGDGSAVLSAIDGSLQAVITKPDGTFERHCRT